VDATHRLDRSACCQAFSCVAPNSAKNQTQREQAISGVKPVVVMARHMSSGTVVSRAGYSCDPDACTLADWKLIKGISGRN
jgi:hypothetical protein